MKTLLQVKDIAVNFHTGTGVFQAVRGNSFTVTEGECLGIVGESGSGKSVTAMSLLHLLGPTAKITSGEALFDGQDLLKMNTKQIRAIRGDRISMIFQDPMSSLNPLIPVGKQVAEMIWSHNRKLPKAEQKRRVLELFEKVHIPEPEKRYNSYPNQFSGGMRQRVMISMALACNPDLLIADEPTTALDVTIQHQILKLIAGMRKEAGMSVIFITHDLGVVAELCTRVIVMYGGLIMEEGPIEKIFASPRHPYTIGLLESIPSIVQDKARRLNPIPGSPPDMSNPPPGCPFAFRCRWARNICSHELPPFTDCGDGQQSRCWMLSPEAPEENNPFQKQVTQ